MPRYFFNVYHDVDYIDHEGEELADQRAAWEEATISAGRILQSIDGKLRPGHDWKMEVTDEFRQRLFVLQICAKRLMR